MTIASMVLTVALVVSLVVNVVLVNRLRAAEKKMEAWKHDRYW